MGSGGNSATPLSFLDYMRQLLKLALQVGINYSDFWELSVGEVIFIIESYNEKAKSEYKKELAEHYALAQNIAVAVACQFAGKQPPTLYEIYPDLFVEEVQAQDDKAWMLYKEQMIDFANRHNKKRGENNK